MSGGALAGRSRRCWRCWGSQMDNPSFPDRIEKLLDRNHERADGKVSQKHNIPKDRSTERTESSGAAADVIKVAMQAMQVEMIVTRGIDTLILASAFGPPTQISHPPFRPRDMPKRGARGVGSGA